MSDAATTTIIIRCGTIFLTAELNDSASARKVAAALPVTSEVGRWGDEVYFEIPVTDKLAADARDVLEAGEIAFWPPGRAVCLFWGRTPSSRGDEIRAASLVNPIGRITGDASVLSAAGTGDQIVVERL